MSALFHFPDVVSVPVPSSWSHILHFISSLSVIYLLIAQFLHPCVYSELKSWMFAHSWISCLDVWSML